MSEPGYQLLITMDRFRLATLVMTGRERIAELEAKLKASESFAETNLREWKDAQAENQRERSLWHSALGTYGRHRPDCMITQAGAGPCDCGLAAIIGAEGGA